MPFREIRISAGQAGAAQVFCWTDNEDLSGTYTAHNGVDDMLNRFCQLRRKEVINLCDGCRLGCVGDVEIKLPEGEVRALIVYGPCRFFGLFGRGEDYYIPWDCVQRFGDDIILIDKPFQRREGRPSERKKRRW